MGEEGGEEAAEGVLKYFENGGHGILYGIMFLGFAGGLGYLTYYLFHQRQEHLAEISAGKHVEATITDAESEHEEKKETFKLGFEFDVGGKPFEVKPHEVEKEVFEKYPKGAKVDVVYPKDGEEGLAEITENVKDESKMWKVFVAGGGSLVCLLLSVWGFMPGKKKEEEEAKERREKEREETEEREREEREAREKIEIPAEHHHHHHHSHEHESHAHSHEHEKHKHKDKEPEHKDAHHHAHVKLKSSDED
jgi:hypothetical protein